MDRTERGRCWPKRGRCWLLTADLHARYYSEVGDAVEGVPAAHHDLVRTLNAINQVARERDVARVFILGDLFHDRRQHHTMTLLAVARGIERLEQHDGMAEPPLVLAGNHDLYEGADTVLEAIEHILYRTEPVDLWEFGGPGAGVGAGVMVRIVPYCRDAQRQQQQIEAEDWAFYPGDRTDLTTPLRRVLLTHAEFTGGRRGPWDYGGVPAGIPPTAVRRFGCTFAGHLHRRQWLQHPDALCDSVPNVTAAPGSILYVGSPAALNRSDQGHQHGCTLFWPATFETEFVPMPGPVYREVASRAELEQLLEQHDPADLVVRAVLPTVELADELDQEFRGCCRSLRVLSLPQQQQDAAKLAVAQQAQRDPDLLRAYCLARGVRADVVDEWVEAGLELLREGGTTW